MTGLVRNTASAVITTVQLCCSEILQMKTVSVALVLCLNVGVDPPDVVKINPCARLECWVGKCHHVIAYLSWYCRSKRWWQLATSAVSICLYYVLMISVKSLLFIEYLWRNYDIRVLQMWINNSYLIYIIKGDMSVYLFVSLSVADGRLNGWADQDHTWHRDPCWPKECFSQGQGHLAPSGEC